MNRQIPWPRILAEGAAIVVSILLAFAIQAWWEQRGDRDEERQLLVGLEADFLSNRAALGGAITFHESVADRLARLEGLTPQALRALSGDSVRAFSSAIHGSMTFDARDGTLDAVIASGSLSLIRDLALRDRLVEWKAMVADAAEEAELFNVAMERTVDRVSELGGPWYSGQQGDGPIARVMQTFSPVDLGALQADNELLGHLRRKRWMSGIYLAELIPLAEHADGLITLIEQSRDR